jgi:radical SAM protein with 4Fe4S-binding SPASM domain
MPQERKTRQKMFSDMGIYNFLRSKHSMISKMLYKRRYKKMVGNGYRVPVPKNFFITPTIRCNLNCKMCFIRKCANLKEMSTDEFKRVVDGIPEMRYVNLTGGEVFVRRDMFDLLDYLEKKGIKVQIGTNGTMINEGNVERLYRNDAIVYLDISIDGTKKTHNMIRGMSDAFEKSMNAIKLLQKKYFVRIVCTMQDSNIGELPDVVREISKAGVKNVFFEYERKYTEGDIKEAESVLDARREDIPLSIGPTHKPAFSLEELKKTLDLIGKASKETGVEVYFLPTNIKKDTRMCYERAARKNGKYFCTAMFKPRIDQHGNVIHCYAVKKPMGNLLEKPFGEIWNSEEYMKFRKDLLSNNLLPICENCLHMQRI